MAHNKAIEAILIRLGYTLSYSSTLIKLLEGPSSRDIP